MAQSDGENEYVKKNISLCCKKVPVTSVVVIMWTWAAILKWHFMISLLFPQLRERKRKHWLNLDQCKKYIRSHMIHWMTCSWIGHPHANALAMVKTIAGGARHSGSPGSSFPGWQTQQRNWNPSPVSWWKGAGGRGKMITEERSDGGSLKTRRRQVRWQRCNALWLKPTSLAAARLL